MSVAYVSEITYKDIPGYQYGALNTSLWSDAPEDSCYCIKQTRDMDGNPSCFLNGVMDMFTVLGKNNY